MDMSTCCNPGSYADTTVKLSKKPEMADVMIHGALGYAMLPLDSRCLDSRCFVGDQLL
jgi:hypothetical protein